VVGEANSTIRKNEECTQNFDGKTWRKNHKISA
jgi:hypothetical protein